MYRLPDARLVSEKIRSEKIKQKREDVIRLVEAQIAGCVDLSPEEMIDAAFIMVNKIEERIDERKE